MNADSDRDVISTLDRKQCLQVFLPDAVAALPNIVENINKFAMTLQEAAVLAVQQGECEVVKIWIDDLRFDIASLVTAAVEYGHDDILATIMSGVPDWCIKVALHDSSKLEIIKCLYSWLERKRSRQGAAVGLVYSAASEGQLDVLEFAIENYVVEFWRNVVLTQSLSNAAKSAKHNQYARYIGHKGFQRLLKRAFYAALKNDHNEIAHCCMLKNDHNEIAHLLYAVCPSYQTCIRGNMFISLIRLGTTDMVRFILTKTQIPFGPRNRAFKIAGALCRIKMLVLLLQNVDISLKTLEHTLKSAIRAKRFDVATLLYKTERISVTVIYNEFKNATSVDVLQFLVETDNIPTEVIQHTFDKAVDVSISEARVSHAKIVKYLSTNKYISTKSIEKALFKGADTNSVLLVKALCNEQNCISSDLATKLFVRAIQNDSINVVNFLWGQPWIPYEKFVVEFIDATRMGCLKTVEWFCKHNRASRDAFDKAIVAAIKARHGSVANILQNHLLRE
ncbi:hypothetical protein PHMEG_00020975 [Phytophthora megakarya]|uniref:Uncharacterized protein n=1 Tax=Phytophthora megakarya TaxID=4795 RepID=A0A225VNQ8_9STRA|nr:hypothetical protein PHMEG_00020975 [Phytophthora megakarya]